MAIGENPLEGLDLSVLDSVSPEPQEKENAKTEEDPGIFNPELKIQEVDELPENEVVEVKENEPELKADKEEDATEEDPQEQVEETSEVSDSEEEVEEDSKPLFVFASLQRDAGLIDFKDEEFEDSEDWLMSQVEKSVGSKISEYKETMPPEIRYLLENYEEGVPLQNLLEMSSKEQTYEALSEANIEKDASLQKALVKDLLARSGWSQERIAKKIERYEDSGVLLEEAQDALASLKDIQKAEKENYVEQQKQEQKQRAEAHNQWLEDLNDHIGKKEEILPGFKLSPKDKEQLYKGITKLDKSGKNEIMRMREKDPEFDLKIAYLATVLKWDFSAFERQSTTKSTRKLADAIKSTKKTGSRPSRGTSKNVDFDTMRKSLR